MAETFSLKIYTPLGIVTEKSVTSVTVPAADGEIQILPQHCTYIGVLGNGTLYATSSDGKSEKYQIKGGASRFEKNVLTVLADKVGD